MANHTIYQFYAELDDFEPIIWRRFQVRSDITVAQLGYIVQVLFEMQGYHLMAFEVPQNKRNSDNIRYEILSKEFNPLFDPDEEIIDATKTKLKSAISKQGGQIHLYYDFGDDWLILMKLEKILTSKDLPDIELPLALDGAGFGIVEDVGGTYGLMNLAEAFKKKKGANYKQFSEWLGVKNFDINAFDLDDMNFRLKKIPRIFKQIYENRKMPTQKSIDLIRRKYLKKK